MIDPQAVIMELAVAALGVALIFCCTQSAQALTPAWPSPYWNIPGDYCKAKYPRMNCCNGRNDPCSVEILGTLCYCDTFCNRTHNSDCCPDYFTHCEGFAEIDFGTDKDKPEELIRPDSKNLMLRKKTVAISFFRQ